MIPAWLWISWITCTLAGFIILEAVALANRRSGDTLSEYIRKWLGIYPPSHIKRFGTTAFVVALVGFVVWFIPHIVFQVW